MNNRRAEQVKGDLVRSVDNLAQRVSELKSDVASQLEKTNARITELKSDLNAQMTSLKADANAQMASLKTDTNAQAGQLRADVSAMKLETKEWVKSEMNAGFATLQLQMVKNHSELLEKLNPKREATTGV